MAKRTAAGEYLAISIQAAKAAGEALTDAQRAAEAGDVPAAQAAAKRAGEESTIAEQAWEALEKHRGGIATEKTARAKTNRDAAADNARLAKDFVKTARRKAKEMAKESAVFDQMADAAAEPVAPGEPFTRHPDDDPAFWEAVAAEPVAAPEPALEGEILEAVPVDGDGMPPALDLDALAIPDARTGFAEIDTEAVQLDYVAEAQKNAEAAELHANSVKGYAEDGNASGARTSAMLAHAAAKRASNFAQAAREAGNPDAEDAQGYADMAAEYAAAAKGHRQTAEDVEAARRIPAPDPELVEALAEIDPADLSAPDDWEAEADRAEHDAVTAEVEAEQAAKANAAAVAEAVAADMARYAPIIEAARAAQAAAEAPEAAEDVPQAPEAVQDAQAAPEAPQPDRLAAARELAGPAIGEQAALWLDPAGLAERLATIAQDAAAAALYWSGKGNADAARKLAVKAGNAAQAATDCATEGEPDAGVIEPHARRARAWAESARKAADKTAG